jgi:ADP-heptose:LPS heptosyltransferase
VLAIRLDARGDVLMTTPAIRALKESKNGRRVTLLTSAAGAEVARFVPEIDDVIVYEAPWMKATAPHPPARDLEMAALLADRGFDAAVIFTVFSQSPLPAAMLAYLADIPLRLAHCRENPYGLLTDWVNETEPDAEIRHEVRRQLDLVASVGSRTSDERLSLLLPRLLSARPSRQRAPRASTSASPGLRCILARPHLRVATRQIATPRLRKS